MSRLLIEGLAIPLQELARQFEHRCELRGIDIVFTSGKRSWQEQIDAYHKGRMESPQGWIVVDPARVVTHALPDRAPHCRGGAFDVAPIVRERPAWDRLDIFAEMGHIGRECGLVWGGDWTRLKDMPHFELPNWRDLPLP
jgi:peptidoglycan L-alanyl-D-glutamate endopeptidase CwlK